MSDELEAILRSVASGEMSPESAMRALDQQKARQAQQVGTEQTAGAGTAAASSPRGGAPAQQAGGTPPVQGTVTCVRVVGSYRAVQIVADPGVAQLYVTGGHRVSQEGTILTVSGTGPMDQPTGERPRDTGGFLGGFSFSDLPRTITWARSWKEHQLVVRVNPELLVELETTGAEVKLSGLTGGLRARVVASSLKADKLRGALDVEAVSSSVKIGAVPTGQSRLYAESSSARLTLLEGSDVRITGTNRMGRLQLPDRPASTLPLDDQTTQSVVGDGRHQLEVESVMSSVTVGAQVWDEVNL